MDLYCGHGSLHSLAVFLLGSRAFCFVDEKRAKGEHDGMEGGNIHGVTMDTLEAVTDEDLYSETNCSPHCSRHFSSNWLILVFLCVCSLGLWIPLFLEV